MSCLYTHSHSFNGPAVLFAEDADCLLQCILTLLHIRHLRLAVALHLSDTRTLKQRTQVKMRVSFHYHVSTLLGCISDKQNTEVSVYFLVQSSQDHRFSCYIKSVTPFIPSVWEKSVITCKNLLRRELRRRTWLIQLLGLGPANLFSSWWMATMAFFLKPGRERQKVHSHDFFKYIHYTRGFSKCGKAQEKKREIKDLLDSLVLDSFSHSDSRLH